MMSGGKPTLILLLLAAVATIGCDGSPKSAQRSELDPYRAKFVLQAAPDDAPLTPTVVKETVTSPTLVTLAGRIDAGDTEPFQAGLATFVLSELPEHGGDDPTHADNCPFCKRKLANAPKAVVQFLGDDGKVLAVDARELFGVDKGDSVVVQGTAEYLEAVDTVQINAVGIFVR